MAKNKKNALNDFNGAKSDIAITMMPNKTNALNDGVKNAHKQQNLSAKVNMPRGAKKPESTPK